MTCPISSAERIDAAQRVILETLAPVELLQKENEDLKRLLAAIKKFCQDCPNCKVLSKSIPKSIRETGMSDYDVARLMKQQFIPE